MSNDFYLLTNKNPYAKGDGWYLPERKEKVQGIVIHCADHYPADELANFWSKTKRPTSIHYVVDDKNIIPMLPPEYTAFHTEGHDNISIGVDIAYYSDQWGSNPEIEQKILKNLGFLIAKLQKNFKLPNRKCTHTEWNNGLKGIIGNAELRPTIYKDPGINFDWVNLIRLIKEFKSQESN